MSCRLLFFQLTSALLSFVPSKSIHPNLVFWNLDPVLCRGHFAAGQTGVQYIDGEEQMSNWSPEYGTWLAHALCYQCMGKTMLCGLGGIQWPFFSRRRVSVTSGGAHMQRERERESVRLKLDVVWWGGRQDD